MRFVIQSILLLLAISVSNAGAVKVEVTITGLRSQKGKIVIGIFKDDPSFQKEEAFLTRTFQKNEILNGEMKVALDLEPGVWGLSLLDDENGSGLMEYNFIGIPKEGFGFSDYYHSGFTKPKFKDFKFSVENGQIRHILVKLRYM